MRRFLLAAPAAALLLVTPAFVSDPAPRADDTELAVHMKAINQATRKLRGAIKDPARAGECVAIVLELQEHALAAKKLEPKRLETVEGDDAKQQFTVDYRKGMHAFLGQTFELEIALLEGRMEDAGEELKELLQMKGPAHDKFQLEDDR